MQAVSALDNLDSSETNDTMMLFGGAALIVLGAGMLLSSSVVRGYLGNLNVMKLIQAAVPDVERYLKLKAM
jgi:hypothetical protein